MLATITTTSKNLKEILGENYVNLIEDKAANKDEYVLTMQVIDWSDVYIENGEDATVEGGYKVSSGNEVEIKYWNINRLQFIADGEDNDNIRFIIT